ncbi:MULE transposase domain containing protein [Nitzschia inconspicua]|uniref:MULE transposase domain containing protein n=2 Tax=Nitzschia inconspicua TaxID=303405 RepID=A0A9K3Q7U8_9STRA|nr:MULE transposase domain containing protein [Nitzschia inconspicua]
MTTELQHSSGLHPDLQKLYDRSCVWDCELLFEEHDDTTDHATKHNLCKHQANGFEYMFPDQYRGLEAKERLVMELKLAALKAGFCLVTNKYQSRKSLPATKQRNPNRVRALAIHFKCDHGTVHRQEASKSKEQSTQPLKNTSAKRPLSRDQVCPFGLTIYMIREDSVVDAGRWFLAKRQEKNRDNCARHSGHIQIAPDLLPKHVRTMSKEEKKLAKQCSQLRFTATSTAALLNLRNALGLAHTPEQVHYLLTQARVTELELAPSATNADKLVKSFSNRTDVCWAMMTFDPQAGVLLESTVKDRKNQLKLDRNSEENARFRLLHNQNRLSSSQKLLLIFLFATVEEMRLLQMHPESISCDVTFGTENTKKQLFTLAACDGNNKAFNCGRAYIPNGQAWVFWHCFRYCLKVFWGESITNRVSLMCTDGCVQEYQAFINNTGDGETFPNAVHTLCHFHTATLSFNNNVSLPPGTAPEAMQRAIDVVRWFVKSWFFEVENCEEYIHSRSSLIAWLERGGGSVLEPHTVNSIKTWITTHLRPLEKMWLNFERLYLCTMDLRTTSISESLHASMKSGHDGVRAGMDTANSANTIVEKSSRVLKERQRQNAREQSRTVKWSQMPTAAHLTEYCLKVAKKEWKSSTSLIVVHAKIDPGEWWVFKEHEPSGGVSAPPDYTRLRCVKLVHEEFLWCSCGLPSRMKYPCRHIYAVTKQVSMCMFGVRWHSQFQHYYGRTGQEEWTEVFDTMMADEFARKHSEGECVCVDGMEFLSQQPESWLSIEDGSNEMVIQAKHLHDLTWVQKRVVVKGLPLPEIRRTEEAGPNATNGSYATNCEEQESISVEQESIFEVECHIPDTIRDLQLSQQNAIASRREQRNAGYAQRVEKFRAILNLAEGRGAWNERIDAHLEEMFVGLTNDIASEKENQKRSSEFAFPETGRSNKRVEKRKKSAGEF